MNNFLQHLYNQPSFLILFIISTVVVVASIPYFIEQQKRYGSYFDFASKSRVRIFGFTSALLIILGIYGISPYVAPPTDEIALVIGNTQNSPAPKLSPEVSDIIVGTMLQHKGNDVEKLADSIKIISAVKQPEVIDLNATELGLRKIGHNNSNAKRSAGINIDIIEKKINTLSPSDNGSNYLEAILEARNNIKEGSRIIVIGSGLSDYGDLNFSRTNILTNEEARIRIIDTIEAKYGADYLDTYNVEFFGLGDTVRPQEALSNKQKAIVRDIYKDTIRKLGGSTQVNTKTLIGNAVRTKYVVSTTDTGCGDIGLIFDDDNLNFVSNKSTFTDDTAARDSLATISHLWNEYRDNIESIQIDGYIAHYPDPDNLSQQRADSVKRMLVDLGIPTEKINATGRGYGPYEKDTQNRMVKVSINRDSEQCLN